MRARLILFVAVIWLMLVAGVVNARFGLVRDARLFDGAPPAKAHRLRLAELWSGRYQAEVERRLERWWGLRGFAIRTDNTVNLALFKETRPTATVVVGRDGWLFHAEDTSFLNRTDDCVACDQLAARLGQVQRRLLASGRLVLPVLTAAKTTTERGQVPARWRRFAGEPRSDRAITQRMLDALARESVLFVDGRAIALERRSRTGQPVFPREARHWGSSPACEVFRAAIDQAARTLGLPLGPADVPACDGSLPSRNSPHDLGHLLNIWGGARNRADAAPPARTPLRHDLRPVVVGSSFMWDFAYLLAQTSFGGDGRFYYYDDAVFDISAGDITGKVDPTDPAWRDWTQSRNLYLVELYEAYLPSPAFGLFLDQLDAAFQSQALVP
ncbi:MAG: hypothetical protein R3B06_09080 [Kofleriaceae bacterium]